jgi:hypothetical protein
MYLACVERDGTVAGFDPECARVVDAVGQAFAVAPPDSFALQCIPGAPGLQHRVGRGAEPVVEAFDDGGQRALD